MLENLMSIWQNDRKSVAFAMRFPPFVRKTVDRIGGSQDRSTDKREN